MDLVVGIVASVDVVGSVIVCGCLHRCGGLGGCGLSARHCCQLVGLVVVCIDVVGLVVVDIVVGISGQSETQYRILVGATEIKCVYH
jgi:hypothetical protein